MRAKGIDMGDVLACLDEDGDHIHEVAIHAGMPLLHLLMFHVTASVCCLVPRLSFPIPDPSLQCSSHVRGCCCSRYCPRFPEPLRDSPKGGCVPHALHPKHAAVPLLQPSTFPVTASVCCPSSPQSSFAAFATSAKLLSSVLVFSLFLGPVLAFSSSRPRPRSMSLFLRI
jgi:hypothetical protein